MRTRYVICVLAVAGSIAGAAGTAAAVTRTPGADGGAAGRTVRDAASSANWSGYVAGGDSASGTQFSAVSGSWTEPSAKCGTGQGYSSFWVGLGGSGQQSGALEQVGTETDCDSGGSASHFAWYELVPSAPVRLDLRISPGDHLTGKVTVNGTDVTVSLSDNTTGASATKTLQMNDPDVSSAEWIAEAPSSCDGSGNCQPLPLADFGNVTFTNATATAGSHTGTISDPDWSSQAVQLDGGDPGSGFVSSQSSVGAAPSGLSSDGSSFSVSSGSAGASSASSGTGGDPYGYGGGSPYGYGGGDPYGYGGGDPYGYGGGDPYGYGGYGGGYGASSPYGYGGYSYSYGAGGF